MSKFLLLIFNAFIPYLHCVLAYNAQYAHTNLHFLIQNEASSCYENMDVHGLILARNGSKGIVNKNLVSVGGKSLLRRSIEVMKNFKKFSSLWVSTDGEKIANEAEKFGAFVHWRADNTATDTATSLSALQEFLNEHKEVDVVALIQCTSPFLRVKYLNEAYELLRQGCDTVFSVTREHKLRWRENLDGHIIPINLNPAQRPRRQDWKGELVENGMFYFTRRNFVLSGVLQGGRIGVVEVSKYESLEIDTKEDLKLARALDDIPLVERRSSNQ